MTAPDIPQFLSNLAWNDIPEDVQNRTRHLLLDLLGTALAGTNTPLAEIISRYTARNIAGTQARVLFSGMTATAEGAALVGGMTIDSVDAHDGHRLTKGHVGCGLLPALLAVIDETNSSMSGTDFLTLLAAGYEIGTRCGIALHATVPDYHTSGAWNAVNCAAIASHVLGLDDDTFQHALGIAEYHGPRSQMMRVIDHPTMLKDGSGWGAMAGVSAAYMAQEGFTGAPAITVTGPEVEDIWSTLGSEWEVMGQYIKGYPVCRWAQPAARAVVDLRAEHAFSSEDVEKLEIETFHQAVRLYHGVPKNTEEAQYGIAFPLVAALSRGKIGALEISESAFNDPELIRLLGATEFKEDKKFSDIFPRARWARVSITLKNGTVLASPDTKAKGDPEDQFTDEEIVAKFHQLADGICPEETLKAIKDAVFNLDETEASFRAFAELVYAKPSADRHVQTSQAAE